MISQWVKDALSHAGISQAELARRLTDRLHRSIDRAAVNKMTLGKRDVSADEMLAIEEITGLPAPSDNLDSIVRVPKISFVSAGKLEPAQPVSPSDIEEFVVADGLEKAGDWIALEVNGDSMNLISPDGSTIFVNRLDTRLIDGAFYVVATEDDDGATFKRYRREPEHFQPLSTNTDHAPVFASGAFKVVGRVYRTTLDLKEPPKRTRK